MRRILFFICFAIGMLGWAQKAAVKAHIVIIHGYDASPEQHWFPYLKQAFEREGCKVSVLTMPTPATPIYSQWAATIAKEVPVLDKHTYIIAHSLGTITTLRYLSEMKKLPEIGGIVLVSALDTKLGDFAFLNDFIPKAIDYPKLIKKVKLRAVISAKDDDIVPFAYSEAVAQRLHADWYPLEYGKHFLDRGGYTEFSLVKEIVMRAIRK